MSRSVLGTFDVLVSWYQVIVHDETVTGYNAWSRDHVRQGFAWRPGSVSFGTLGIVGMRVDVRLDHEAIAHPGAMRIIRVPFRVRPRSAICLVASLSRWPIPVPRGDYALYYEHGVEADRQQLWAVLTFVPDPAATAAVLLADEELDPPAPLVMAADAA